MQSCPLESLQIGGVEHYDCSGGFSTPAELRLFAQRLAIIPIFRVSDQQNPEGLVAFGEPESFLQGGTDFCHSIEMPSPAGPQDKRRRAQLKVSQGNGRKKIFLIGMGNNNVESRAASAINAFPPGDIHVFRLIALARCDDSCRVWHIQSMISPTKLPTCSVSSIIR